MWLFSEGGMLKRMAANAQWDAQRAARVTQLAAVHLRQLEALVN